MHTGLTVRKIRKRKHIPANSIYKDLLSRSSYYKYESGISETNANYFLEILNRLNVSLDEFQHTMDEGEGTDINYEWLLRQYRVAIYDNDPEMIKQIMKKINDEYSLEKNLKSQHMVTLGNAILKKMNHDPNLEPERKELVGYLFMNENWMHYELVLFNNIFFLADLPVIDMLFKRIEGNMEIYQNISKDIDEISLITCHIIEMAIMEDDEEMTSKYYHFLMHNEVINSNKRGMFAKSVANFYMGIYYILNDDYVRGYDLCKKVLDTFAFLEMTGELNQYNEILNRVMKKIK